MQAGYSQQVKKMRLDGKQLITLLNKNDALQFLKKQLTIPNNYEFQVEAINGTKNVAEFTDYLGYTHERYTQYYKDIKIEHSDIRVHYCGDTFVSANGEYVDAQNIDISINLSK